MNFIKTFFINFIFSISIVIFLKWKAALNAMNINWTNIVSIMKLFGLKYWFAIQFNSFCFVCLFSSSAISPAAFSAATSASLIFAKLAELWIKLFAIFSKLFSPSCWFLISFIWRIFIMKIVSLNCLTFLMMYSIVFSFHTCCSSKKMFRTKMIFCLCDIQTW